MIHSSNGTLRYSQCDDSYWLVVDVDDGIVELARALVPKWIKLNRTRYNPHITVVRNERPVNFDFWRKYDGQTIDFTYSNHVYNNDVYWWLNVYCPRLKIIRQELGLESYSELSRPPDGTDCFHITIGNTK